MTTAYCCVLALLVSGEKLDPFLFDKMMDLVKTGDLPFNAVMTGKSSHPSRTTSTCRGPDASPRPTHC